MHTGCFKDRNLKYRLLPNGKKIPIEKADLEVAAATESGAGAERKRDVKGSGKKQGESGNGGGPWLFCVDNMFLDVTWEL